MDIYSHRHSIRMPGFDYRSAAGYFISLVVADRGPLFGILVNAQVQLSPEGTIVSEEWAKTPVIRPTVTLDEWIIMPDHFQAILWINGTVNQVNGIVGAGSCPPEITVRF